MANKLIQWNCRGLKANFNELLLLLTGLCPSIVCLQETFLKPTDNINIRGYTLYNHIHQAGDRASGGSTIVVNNSVPQSLIPLNTNLQADRSPIRGLRQSPTPRQRIQLEKTNSKNRFSVLEAEESMECGAPPSAPSSPTSQHPGKNPSQTPKPQRTKSHE